MEAGEGTPLVHLHGAGGMRLTKAHDLLSRRYRVIVFEMPGFGPSPENTRTRTVRELGATMGAALSALGVERFNLMATSFGARVALWLAVRLAGTGARAGPGRAGRDPAARPQAAVRHAGRDRAPDLRPSRAARAVARSRTPSSRRSSAHWSAACADPIATRIWKRACATWPRRPSCCSARSIASMPPEMGRHYKTLLPNCHLVFVYDAGHEISTDRPEAFADVTDDFLRRHEAFVISRAETRHQSVERPRRSADEGAAVHVQDRAGEIACRRRAQERDRPGQFLRPAHAASGNCAPDVKPVVIGVCTGPGATPFTSTPRPIA